MNGRIIPPDHTIPWRVGSRVRLEAEHTPLEVGCGAHVGYQEQRSTLAAPDCSLGDLALRSLLGRAQLRAGTEGAA
jgi:hypothetical protein